MINIMNSEFYKVRKSKITLVTALVLFGSVLMMFGMLGMLKLMLGGEYLDANNMTAIDAFAGFPTGDFYYLFVALFAGGLIATEYTTGTVRQVVSRGVARWKIALGQYITIASVMTLITFVIALIRSVVFGMIWEFGTIGFTNFLLVLLGWIVVIWSYTAFSVLVAHITRSGGFSIGINIMVLLGGEMAALVLSQVTHKEFFYKYWLTTLQTNCLNYPFPAMERLGYMGVLTIFGVICLGLSMFLFSKRDIS